MAEIVIRELQYPITSLEILQSLKTYPDFFFLDSALTTNEYGKYSFLGIEPFLKMKLTGSKIIVEDSGGVAERDGDPFEHLRRFLNSYKINILKNYKNVINIPFIGGAVGYFSYDMCHFIEEVPDITTGDLGFPDMYFGFYDTFVAVDHAANKCYAVSLNIDNNADTDKKIERLVEIVSNSRRGKNWMCNNEWHGKTHELFKGVRMPADSGFQDAGLIEQRYLSEEEKITSNFTRKGYIEAVKKAKKYIMAGDIYQVNLSQRFQAGTSLSPFRLYERLRSISPAPYSSFIGFNGLYIISSSPERFLCARAIDNRFNCNRKVRAQIRPIKGTRPKHNDRLMDERIKDELLSSPKDNAELTMIVDLERNDLGRVCDYGSVKVVERKVLESFSTVHHLVSTIEGDLSKKYDIIDLIKAAFPGGSITGVPKIRAMEIIYELESTKRSVYTGAIGYIGFDGNVDLSMAIRTLLMKGDQVFFQVGGAIVADSDPLAEYEETLYKAFAMMKAIRD